MNLKIQEGEAHNIFCPAYDCFQLVPVDIIESVVSKEMDKRYLQFDIKAFVENNPAIKWCPTPGCERAVRLTKQGSDTSGSDTLSFPCSELLLWTVGKDTSSAGSALVKPMSLVTAKRGKIGYKK